MELNKQVDEAVKCFITMYKQEPYRIRASLVTLQKLAGIKNGNWGDCPVTWKGMKTLASHKMGDEYFLLEAEPLSFKIDEFNKE